MQALIRPGSVVGIREPTTIRLLDILDHMKAQIIPVRSDADGPSLVRRIAVAPGSKFQAAPGAMIRMATSRLTADLDTVADALSLLQRDVWIRFRDNSEY